MKGLLITLNLFLLVLDTCFGSSNPSYFIVQQDSMIVSDEGPIKTLIFCNYSEYSTELFDESNLNDVIHKRLFVLSQSQFEDMSLLIREVVSSCKIGELECWYNIVEGKGDNSSKINLTKPDLILLLNKIKNSANKYDDPQLKSNIIISIEALLVELEG